MADEDIAQRVKKIIIEHLNVDEDKVVDGAKLIDDLGADSLDIVELAMTCEESFRLDLVDEAEIEDANFTVADLIAYVKKHQAASN